MAIPQPIELLLAHLHNESCVCTCEWWFDWYIEDGFPFSFKIMHDHNVEQQRTFLQPQISYDPSLVNEMIEWCHEVAHRCPRQQMMPGDTFTWKNDAQRPLIPSP